MKLIETIKNCPELKKYTKNESDKIDLGDPEALAKYNQCQFMLLDGLNIKIPLGNLIPTAGLRRCIVDILCKETNPKSVLEIGTGSTGIIAQLFALRGKEVFATEIDINSIKKAKENINSNFEKFKHPIHLIKSEGGLLKWLLYAYKGIFPIDLAISLPPYYEEGSRSSTKVRGFQGTKKELFSTGMGEDFSVQLIQEFFLLRSNISNLSLLWKDENSFIKGFDKFKSNQFENILYKIHAGSRTRYLTITKFKS